MVVREYAENAGSGGRIPPLRGSAPAGLLRPEAFMPASDERAYYSKSNYTGVPFGRSSSVSIAIDSMKRPHSPGHTSWIQVSTPPLCIDDLNLVWPGSTTGCERVNTEKIEYTVQLSDEEMDQVSKILELADCQGKSFIDCPSDIRCRWCPFGQMRQICRTLIAESGRWMYYKKGDE